MNEGRSECTNGERDPVNKCVWRGGRGQEAASSGSCQHYYAKLPFLFPLWRRTGDVGGGGAGVRTSTVHQTVTDTEEG